ncbi:hypothetical protein [Pyrobaculum sp.]|uniref:hypothetical protein n=1 Tax=Pyrobaculum sp. TaxID=2004705 RepID=UPI003D10BE39
MWWVVCLFGATEDFLNWMYGVYMASVLAVLGVHANVLRRYGVSPEEDVEAAVSKLAAAAPHIAEFLREVSRVCAL